MAIRDNDAMTLSPARRFPLIVLAYLGPLAVIPLLVARQAARDDDVRWHAWQGLLFSTGVMAIVGGLTAIAGLTALSSLPGGITLGIVTWLVWTLALVVQLAALAAGLTGARVVLPVCGWVASRLVRRGPPVSDANAR